MAKITIDINNIYAFADRGEIEAYDALIKESLQKIKNKSGAGSDYLGWVDLPENFDEGLIADIENTARQLQEIAEVVVVTGIGGSYLGARAVIEALKHHFEELRSHDSRRKPLVVYAGQNLSEDYLADLMEILNTRDYAMNVISKSGTTTEPAVAFRILRQHLEDKYGPEGARKRIVATTDSSKGALRKLAEDEGYKTFVVPDDVGGRYSVLTPVGLLPIAIAGFDIRRILQGASAMQAELAAETSIEANIAATYAAARNALYKQGRLIEVMVGYLPSLQYFIEWWKQLYGESEGKDGKGIFPAGVINTTDLHSMGQYIQEGERKIFETVISVERAAKDQKIPSDKQNLDKLNYLAGKNVNEVNLKAETATTLAHVDGGVPNIRISIPQLDEYHLGALIYFFEYACALSGYVLGINPFNQPGVEAYKNNMFALLGKPGFEKQTEEINKRLDQH
ncbi:MAG: glucose-6-phosphate isomerase [Bacteroidales bacterium]